MRVDVKNYLYRHFDNMLILQTEDDNVLYIYCPSECIYDDNRSRFYCYRENIIERAFLKVDYVDYHTESNSIITCDGVAHFIQYSTEKNDWYLWEKAHGKLGTDQLLIHLDNDKRNCELSNLYVVSRATNRRMAAWGWFFSDLAMTLTAVRCCELLEAAD